MAFEYPIHRQPCGFKGVFARKERPVSLHGVAQKPFVRRLLVGLFI
jgi:hypothetical protein